MKFKLIYMFLLGGIPIYIGCMGIPDEEKWVADTTVMYNVISIYNEKNGVLPALDKQKFKETLDILEQEIEALNPEEYDIAAYKKEYVNSYKAWEPYILKASDHEIVRKSNDKTADKVVKKKVAVQKNIEKQSLSVSKKDSSQKINENAWIEKALALYEVVDEYAQQGYVSADKQEMFLLYLRTLEKEIDELSSKKYTVSAIAEYKAVYVDPYKEWESFIVQEVDDVSQPSSQELQIKANAEKQQQIFKDVEQKIIMHGDQFFIGVKALLEGLGEYSKANQEAFYKNLESEVNTFKSYMKTLKNNAMNSYFLYLKNSSQAVDVLHLTPDQHKLISGVNKIVQQMVSYVEAVVLDITANISSSVFVKQAEDAFIQYEKKSEADYQRALETNLKSGNKDDWDALKNSGDRILKGFEIKMKNAVKKQAEEQIQKVLEEKGAELAEAIGKKAKEVGGVALEKIKNKANEVGSEAFDKLNERANAIGGETLSNFKKKANDLGGDALENLIEKGKSLNSDVANKVKDKIVEELKKQTSNQIGVDVDALGEVLFDKKVSPEALKKVMLSRYSIPENQKKAVVQVQQNSNLCAQEKSYIKNRLIKIEETLREEFDIDKPLRLAFSFSGGGNRAMIGTLGLLIGAARHKILDVTMYLAGLSGSTWAIAPWSYMYLNGLLTDETEESQKNPLEYSLQQFKTMLTKVLDYKCPLSSCPAGIYPPAMLTSDIQMAFTNNIAKRFAYDQQITVVNLWGALVSNYALKKIGPGRLNVTWSSMAQGAEKGLIPLPICSSIFDMLDGADDRSGYRTQYTWFESGPFEAGSTKLGFIPVWALGSTFKDGKIISHVPESEMSDFLGIYGSAFAVSVNDLIDKGTPMPLPTFKVAGIEIKLPVDTWIRKLIDGAQADIRTKRSWFAHYQFANYSKGLQGSALKDKDQLGLFDGGLYFNIPLPLLFDRSERAVDVVIMYDSNPVDLQCLVDASRYFVKNGTVIPNLEIDPVTGKTITKEGLLSRSMTVFNDPRNVKTYKSQQPTLIYFPTPAPKADLSKAPYNIDLVKYSDIKMPIDVSRSPYVSLNFKYTSTEVENLSQTMEAIFESQVDEIKLIMKLVSKEKS